MQSKRYIVLSIIFGMFVSPCGLNAATLTVPLIGQQKNQWCWNACSLMVMTHLAVGPHPSQQMIADWATAGYNFPNHLSTDAVSSAYTKDQYGVGNPAAAVTILRRGMSAVIEHYATNLKTSVHGQISSESLQREIDNDRPVIARIAWYKTLSSYNANNNDGGGHVVVVMGFDGTTMSINDPWPPTSGDFYTAPITTFQGSTSYYSGPHRWTHTVKIAGSLDLVFLIDSTGSMGDDIANVKTNVNTLIDDITNRFKDYRIAVMDYKDYPQSPYGDPSDYTYQVRTSFANTNSTAAKAAINGLSASGGNDWPESVYSALDAAVSGTVLGGWRPDPVERNIFVLGDAPGHDPEPFPGGKSSTTVLAKARSTTLPIHVHTLLVGTDTDAEAMFGSISGATGGLARQAANASEVSPGLTAIVNEIDTNPRLPRGDIASFLPAFTFELPTGGMQPSPSSVELQIMRFDSATWFWKSYLTAIVPKGQASYVAKSPFPLGRYQWRVNWTTPSYTQYLPDLTKISVRGGKQYDDDWTEFNRLLALPGDPSSLAPYPYGFTASGGTVTYSWTKAINASKHALRITQNGKVWKNIIVSEPASSTTDTRTLKLTGHRAGYTYTWKVQGLNYDRPKADETKWTP